MCVFDDGVSGARCIQSPTLISLCPPFVPLSQKTTSQKDCFRGKFGQNGPNTTKGGRGGSDPQCSL